MPEARAIRVTDALRSGGPIVDFEPGFLVYLTVENIGRTMAQNVSIHFDKPLESSLQGRRELDESPLFREPIPALPPGKKIRVLFDSFSDLVAPGFRSHMT